jgi:hypothetical protein
VGKAQYRGGRLNDQDCFEIGLPPLIFMVIPRRLTLAASSGRAFSSL